MTKQKHKKVRLPSDEFVESKKSDIESVFQQILDGTIDISSAKQTVADKLDIIKSELLLLKDKNVPYSIIKKILEEKIDLSISEQTLRQYCQNRLGFPKKERAKKQSAVELKNFTDSPFKKMDDSKDAKSVLTKKVNYD